MLSPVLLSLLVAAPQTPDHTVIYTTLAGDPTAAVPGLAGSEFDNFSQISVSPSGNHWALSAKRDASNSFDDLIIVDGQFKFLEAFTFLPWLPTQQWHSGWVDINDAGHVLLASGLTGSTSYTSHMVFSGDLGQNWAIRQTEGPAAGIPGATWQVFVDPQLTADGRSGFRAELGNVTSSTDEAQYFDGNVLGQNGVTIPGGQTGNSPILSYGAGPNGLQVSDDGAHTLTRAWISAGGTSERVAIFDGNVIVEGGTTLPGFSRPIAHIDGLYLSPAGAWFVWGRNEANTYRDWVLKEGVVIAEENQPIIPGTLQRWNSLSNLGEAFKFARGNDAGETLVWGTTNNPVANVLVRNGAEVVMRRGDPIDVDNNGIFDDNMFLSDIRSLSDWTSSGDIWASIALMNSGGSFQGDALVRFELGGGPGFSTFCSPADPNSTGVPSVMAGSFGSGVGSDLHLEVSDGPTGQFGYMVLGTAFSEPGTPISNGHLCVSGSVGRFNIAGTVFNSLGSFNASGDFNNLSGTATSSGGTGYDVPVTVPISGSPMISTGSTWHFQLWHRENGGMSNFSSGLSATF